MNLSSRISGISSTVAAFVFAMLPAAALAAPTVHYFVATPGAVTAGQATTLRWAVDGADSVEISGGIGPVARDGTVDVIVTDTRAYRLTARQGTTTTLHELTVEAAEHPSTQGGRFVRMVSPVSGQQFLAPGSIRPIVAAYDPTDASDNERNAEKVAFYVDGVLHAEVAGANSEYWIFKTFFGGLAPGAHRVWARAFFKGNVILDSEPVWIEVESPASYAQTVRLSGDLVLSGTQSYSLTGTPQGRILLDAQGHRLRSHESWAGALVLQHVDVVNLGKPDNAEPGLELDARNDVLIADCKFETSSTLHLDLSGSARVRILRNEFRSNAVMPLAQLPEFEPQASYPALRVRGFSSGPHEFRGNRMGAGWLDLKSTRRWTVGGIAKEDANVFIGPRVGVWMRDTQQSRLVGNVIYHVYFGGWSQGNVVEADGSHDIVIEHNIIGGGSWPLRGVSGEVRYNLVLDAGHEWIWITGDAAAVHHNIFAGGEGDVAPVRFIYPQDNVAFYNNTLDGLGARSMRCPIRVENDASVRVQGNAITGMPNAPQVCVEGELVADYNLFHGRIGSGRNYSDLRAPSHDVGGADAQVDPKFAGASDAWRFDWQSLWTARVTPAQVLAFYRERYTPRADSPLIGAGPVPVPSPDGVFSSSFESGEGHGAASAVIGAVGVGEADPEDRFGRELVP